jgi:hypothetical protein
MVSPNDSQPASTIDPEPAPGSVGDASGEFVGEGGPAPAAGSETWPWVLTLAVGLAAGLIAWACGEAALIPEIAVGGRGGGVRTLPDVIATRNAVVSFGILGAALGMGLGLAGGLIRRSVLSTVLAATIGLVLGGLSGAGVSWLTLPVYYKHRTSNDLTYSLLVHAGTWMAIGAAAGLAFGFGRGEWGRMLRCLLGAAASAMLATIIYELAGMMLFPFALTDRPLSNTWETRLLARVLVAVMVAAGAFLCGSRAADGRAEKP